jgi:hypothetical protein
LEDCSCPRWASRLSGPIVLLFFALLLAGSAADATVQACDGSTIRKDALRAADAPAPMDPPSSGSPTVIEASIQITELRDIDVIGSRFGFEGYADFRWCDPRTAFDAEVEGRDVRRYFGTTDDFPMWRSDLSVANGVGAMEVTRRLIEIHADGRVRVSGYFNTLVAEAFDLRRFPFDRQTLEIQLESFTHNSDIVRFVTSDDRVSYAPDLFIPEWRFVAIEAHVETTASVRDRIPFSRAVVTLHIARESGFYLYKLWLPLFLIVVLSWSIFWMTDETFANRIRISATAFLTVVAYQFAVAGNLPKAAYLTLMDRLMIASFVLIALSAAESLPVVLLREKSPQRAARLDQMSRWLFPLGYVGVLVGIAVSYWRA